MFGEAGFHALIEIVAIGLFVAIFRIVRTQYGPTLAVQPYVTGGPQRLTLLGISGVLLIVLVGALQSLTRDFCGTVQPVRGNAIIALTMGGILHVLVVGIRARSRHLMLIRVKQQRISAGRGYIVREIVLTLTPWLALAGLAAGVTLIQRELEFPVLLIFVAAFGSWLFAFQILPHILLSSPNAVLLKMPGRPALLRDGLMVLAGAWFLIAAEKFGWESATGRLMAIVPLLFAGAALVVKMRERDALSEPQR